MKQSEVINELATALAKAQGEIQNAKKDAENPFFKSKYADLASVWDAIRTPLSKNGLCIIQTTGLENEQFVLFTHLVHQSGQWVSSVYPINPVKNDPQSLGSATTYARRYSLQGIVGVAPEEDDGNAATHTVDSRPAPFLNKGNNPTVPVSEPQLKRLYAIQKSSSWNETDVKAYLVNQFGLSSSKELNRAQYDQLVDAIQKGLPVKEPVQMEGDFVGSDIFENGSRDGL